MNEERIVGYLSISQTAEKWGISQRRIRVLCVEGRIPGAFKMGAYWSIPDNAEKPKDNRIKTGRYIKEKSDYEQQNYRLLQPKCRFICSGNRISGF